MKLKISHQELNTGDNVKLHGIMEEFPDGFGNALPIQKPIIVEIPKVVLLDLCCQLGDPDKVDKMASADKINRKL